MDILSFFLAPFCMCLVLVGIHCYLGIHVLQRGVIFVDLSLAQVAALGATVAMLFHFEPSSNASYLISLGHTFFAAGLFAWGRKTEKWISQEVLIGVVYALSSALVILALQNLSHGAEHIKKMLVGRILWVSWADVLKTVSIYALVSGVHFFLREKMFAVSRGEQIKSKTFWDFVFFALFGVVIASSVGVAGILLVFSFLIVPALVSSFFFRSIRLRLLFGWVLGFVVCALGMILSYQFDMPAGALLVVCLTLLPILALPFLRFCR